MTDQREFDRLLDDFFVEGTDELADRVIDAALDEIDHTQQRRASRLPRRFPTMNTYSRIAAAAVIGVLAIGGTLYLIGPGQRAVGPPGPAVVASSTPDLAAGVSPSPSASQPVPTPSPSSEPCLTFEIQTGDELPDVSGDPVTGIGPGRGVFLAGSTLFAVGPGDDPARPIAAVKPSTGGLVEFLDLSADGSNALIRAGFIGGGNTDPECADLLVVRTDGSGVTRLTSFEAGRIVSGAAFSPDGTRVAYTSLGVSSPGPETITVLDLASGRRVEQPCDSAFVGDPAIQVDWSPTGDRVALVCRGLTIFDASGTAAPIEVPTIGPNHGGFGWTDASHLIVADGGADIESFDVVTQTSTLVGRLDAADLPSYASGSGVFSPDGRWLAFLNGSTAETYLVAASGGPATRVLDEDEQFVAWTADSRALVHTTSELDSQLATQVILGRVDAETLQRSRIATLSNYSQGRITYRQGVWLFP